MSDLQEEGLFSIRLEGDGITVERKLRPEVARAIINIVLGGGSAAYSPPTPALQQGAALSGTPQSVPVRPLSERLSLREYLDDSGAARNPDKILVIGSFLIEHEGAPDFSRDEVKNRFRTAGEAPPANYPRDFSVALRSGWIAEDPQNRSRFFVTQKGRAAIAGKFSADVKKSVKSRTVRRVRRRGEDEVEAVEE